MRAITVEVIPELPQLVFEIDSRPEQRAIQWQANLRILEVAEIKTVPYVPLSHPFVERLIGTVRREYLLEPIKRIVVGAKILRHRSTASNGVIEHPAERDTIDHSGMDAKADDPASVLIHDDQDPVGPQRG
jgi:hypothetical protein